MHTDAFPTTFLGPLAQPLAGNVRPDLILDPWLRFVADPSRFPGKYQSRLAFEWKEHVHIAVHDLETRHVQHRAFKPGILVAAHEQRVEMVLLHPRTDVLIAAGD